MSSCRSRADAGERGFTLVEVLVCTLVLTIGMVAVAGMLAVSVQAQIGARESARSMRLAQTKLDELTRLDFSNPAMTIGGNLEANVANKNDVSPDDLDGITIRWLVEAGPTGDTRVVTVRVVNLRAQQYRNTDLTTMIRQW